MKSIKGFALGLALGVAVAIGTVGVAQTTKPADQTQKAESCAMECCCHGDSGSMHKGAGMKHAQGEMKHAAGQMKGHEGENGCCCCGGDSCDMQMNLKEQEKPKQE
jgi:hypothetical protein